MAFYEEFKSLVNENITEEKTKDVFDCYMNYKYNELNEISKCESPIEKILFITMKIVELSNENFKIIPQYLVEFEHQNYRIDFLIRNCKSKIEIIVECDGYEYHGKNPKKVKEDKKRDRLLQKKVDAVLRFTGSEINSHPYRCADEIFEMLKIKKQHLKLKSSYEKAGD